MSRRVYPGSVTARPAQKKRPLGLVRRVRPNDLTAAKDVVAVAPAEVGDAVLTGTTVGQVSLAVVLEHLHVVPAGAEVDRVVPVAGGGGVAALPAVEDVVAFAAAEVVGTSAPVGDVVTESAAEHVAVDGHTVPEPLLKRPPRVKILSFPSYPRMVSLRSVPTRRSGPGEP